MKKMSIFAVAVLIFLGLGVCAVMGAIGVLTSTSFRATATPTFAALQNTPIETPIARRILPSLTPLPAQVGVRPSQTASSLTRTAYPTDIAFYTTIAPTRPVVVSEGTATKYFLTVEPLLTLVMYRPSGSTGLCRDGRYTSLPIKQDACHYDGGIYAWWGPTPVK